ncbi:hypothetical protein BDW75DRAFT_226616 [Aspergillus navahoensis]
MHRIAIAGVTGTRDLIAIIFIGVIGIIGIRISSMAGIIGAAVGIGRSSLVSFTYLGALGNRERVHCSTWESTCRIKVYA